MRRIITVLLALVFLVGCASAPKEKDFGRALAPGQMALEKITDPSQIPDFRSGFNDSSELIESIDRSLSYFAKPSSKQYFPYLDVSHARAIESLIAFKDLLQTAPNADTFHRELVRRFDVYRSIGWDGSGEVLYTAYCEPIYPASMEKTGPYQYPLYTLPSDHVKEEDGTPLGRKTTDGSIVPYYTRQEIEDGQLLAGQELVWLKNRLEAFIVHVQGSARLELPDGRQIQVGYAGKTDRPYTSIGKALIRDEKIRQEDMSLQAIKRYFARHPAELEHYLYQNESYVFFTHAEGGPFGSLNVKVTPYRSIATDKAVFPRGCLAFTATEVPVYNAGGRIVRKPFNQFVLDQDTGGAIRSAGRADLFIGTGPEAERLAGHTKEVGRLYYVFLKMEQ